MSKIMMITPQMHFSVFPHIILGHPPFTLPERHPGYFTTTLMQPISNVCQLLFPKPLSNLFSLHGGGSAPSCCAFTHRVAFEEGSGPRVLLQSGPGNRGAFGLWPHPRGSSRISS